MSNERTLRVVLAQTKPRKNHLAANVARLKRALVPEADVMLFPETALSGYFLEGGVAEAALSRSELAEALGRPPGGCACDVAVGFYEKDRQGLYNSLAYLAPREDRYDVVHVHRKVFLPTYGLFDEARFVVPGSDVRAFDTRFGRMGMLVCEDLWHGLPAAVLALDGAEVILCAAASPARGFRPGQEEAGREAAPANLAAWNQVGSRTAREHGVFVAVSQLAGSEGGKVMSGGSAAWGPDGALVARGPLFASGSALAPLPMEDIARIRAKAPYLARLRAALPDLRRSLDRAARGDLAPPLQPQDADGAGQSTRKTGEIRARAAASPARLAAALEIDAAIVAAVLTEFIRDEAVRRRGFARAVVGVSGGVDSAVALFLACEALGPRNVFAFRLPHSASSQDSLDHAKRLVLAAGAQEHTVPVTEAANGYLQSHEPDADPLREGNFVARLRAAILFDQSAKLGALPVGTGNKSERLLGYFTWHADDSPPINPLGDLFKTQVLALARHLGVPGEIVSKAPSPDLVPGVHDEDELGISYERADPILNGLVRGYPPETLVRAGFPEEEVELVRTRLSATHWKRCLPTVALLSDTAIGESYLRPVDY